MGRIHLIDEVAARCRQTAAMRVRKLERYEFECVPPMNLVLKADADGEEQENGSYQVAIPHLAPKRKRGMHDRLRGIMTEGRA